MLILFEITDTIVDEHIDKIVDIVDNIKLNKVTILVGDNGVGKSLIRKQMGVRFYKEYQTDRGIVRQVSMQQRTESNPTFGALSSCLHDWPTSPTSLCTYNLLNQALGGEFTLDKPYYLVIDELEIGMSKESIVGAVDFVSKKIPYWLENTLGVLIITHSDIVVDLLTKRFDCDFIYLGYNTVDSNVKNWLDRNVVPTDFEWLDNWSNTLFKQVRDRSKSIK